MPAVLTRRSLRQEDHKFEGSLGHIDPVSKKEKEIVSYTLSLQKKRERNCVMHIVISMPKI
jgi:hypothetical protein